jgi:hypothetical protein
MRFDWRRIPIIREGFRIAGFPIATFTPEDVEVIYQGRLWKQPWPVWNSKTFLAPRGWQGHCEAG